MFPRKFYIGEQVYNTKDFNNKGRPTYKRLWIYEMEWSKNMENWWYKVQDEPKPKGKNIGWYSELDLELLPR
jgi:hypothetical protein